MRKSILNGAGSTILEENKCIFMGLKNLFSSQLDFHILECLRKILSFKRNLGSYSLASWNFASVSSHLCSRLKMNKEGESYLLRVHCLLEFPRPKCWLPQNSYVPSVYQDTPAASALPAEATLFLPGYDLSSVAVPSIEHALSMRSGFRPGSQSLLIPPCPSKGIRSSSRSPFLPECLSCSRIHRALLSLGFLTVKLGDGTRDDPFGSDSLMIL